jgi:hypothetical protein
MARTTVIRLTDDFDGGDADETVRFSLDGKAYEIDLNKRNASALRKTLAPYVDKARSRGRAPASGSRRSSSNGSTGSITAFSRLNDEEKTRFRKWAKMPDARRISDERVQQWAKAGRP